MMFMIAIIAVLCCALLIRFYAPKHRRALTFTGLCLLTLGFCWMATGCAGLPQWLADAQQLFPMFATSAGTILTLIGSFTGNPELASVVTLITGVSKLVEAGITDVQAMVAEYEKNPSTTLLSSIEAGAQAVIDNLNRLLTDINVPSGAATPIVNLATLLLQQFEAWASVIPTLKVTTADHDVHALKTAISHLKAVPMTAKAYKAAHNAILDTPTGDAAMDAVLAKVARL